MTNNKPLNVPTWANDEYKKAQERRENKEIERGARILAFKWTLLFISAIALVGIFEAL